MDPYKGGREEKKKKKRERERERERGNVCRKQS